MELHKIPVLGSALGFLEGEDIDYGIVVFFVGLFIIFFGLNFINLPQSSVVSLLFASAPIWLPIMAFLIFFQKYMEMVGKKFGLNSGRTIYEIILPPEVFKSPEAMEYVFTQVYNASSPDNLMETYLDGKRPTPYSFELVSRGGDVHFYASMPNKFVYGFTDNMYAQYPGVEIKKLDVDYAAEIPHDLKGVSFMSFHFSKKKNEVYPIKTYIDFGMDKLPKEEEKVDPMTPMLEMLAGIRPNQQMWIQILCVAHRDKNFKNGQLKSKGTWDADIAAEIDNIMKRDPKTKGPLAKGDSADFDGMPRITAGERDTIEAMERNGSKFAFETAIRVVYISHKEGDYDGGLFSRFIRTFAQTEIKGRNGLGFKWRTDYNYKFISDPFGKKIPALKRHELKEYKSRKLYPKTGGMGFKVMSAEELATIFHLPGAVALTPTLNRVTSTRGEAPSNLPIGNLPI
ncbi:MAG: hypothetical protein ACI92I_000731 [Acidimicrobiales bacterium]|jgi:hypothetical protein